MSDRPRYRLTLEALPADAPGVIRLRAALKPFLRRFRLRRIAVGEITAEALSHDAQNSRRRGRTNRG